MIEVQHTLENILILSIDRRQILTGKIIVLALLGLFSALLALLKSLVSLNLIEGSTDNVLSVLRNIAKHYRSNVRF